MRDFLILVICAFSCACQASDRSPNAELVVYNNGKNIDVLVISYIDGICVDLPDLGSNLFLMRNYEEGYELIESPIKAESVARIDRVMARYGIVGVRFEVAYLAERFDFVSGERIRFLYSPLGGQRKSNCRVQIGELESDYLVP